MKITKRMKKILLFLLLQKNKHEWISRSDVLLSCAGETSLARSKFITYEYSRAYFSQSEFASHLRTLRILVENGLITSKYPLGERRVNYLRLTEKGNRLAEEIKREIKPLVKEYKELIG